MKDFLFLTVFNFLKKNYDLNRPVLLALSGGPDSLALLHLLLDYRQENPLSFSIAHVNHGWRPESVEEAKIIAEIAEKYHFKMHLKTLDPKDMKGNLEAVCRRERIRFFTSLCERYDYQAVFLAHHADDLAETVLKRTLEGASLSNLSGMCSESTLHRIKLWRPLLSVSKKSILNWLESRGLKGFHDKTNLDPRFLRGKFRTKIIPELSAEFGKEIGASLCRLGSEASELRDYLKKRIKPYLSQMVSSKLGCYLDLQEKSPEEDFEMKFLIRKFCEINGFALSHDNIEKACLLIRSGTANKTLINGGNTLYIDRKILFSCPQPFLPLPKIRKKLEEGNPLNFGSWEISMAQCDRFYKTDFSDWQMLWQKEGMEVTLPKKEYEVASPEISASYPGSTSLGKWWTDHKIPAFLRLQIPIICSRECVEHEFLTGKIKTPFLEKRDSKWIKIAIYPKLMSCGSGPFLIGNFHCKDE